MSAIQLERERYGHSLEEVAVARLAAEDLGHRVTLTPVGPRYVAECSCGEPERRFAGSLAAVLHGLRHVFAVLAA